MRHNIYPLNTEMKKIMSKIISYLGINHGLGKLAEIRVEWMHKKIRNITLGLHAEDEELYNEYDKKIGESHSIYFGVFFIRIVFEFRTYE